MSNNVTKQLPNRMDIKLIDKVKIAAKNDNRSVNSWLINLLHKELKT